MVSKKENNETGTLKEEGGRTSWHEKGDNEGQDRGGQGDVKQREVLDSFQHQNLTCLVDNGKKMRKTVFNQKTNWQAPHSPSTPAITGPINVEARVNPV